MCECAGHDVAELGDVAHVNATHSWINKKSPAHDAAWSRVESRKASGKSKHGDSDRRGGKDRPELAGRGNGNGGKSAGSSDGNGGGHGNGGGKNK